MTASALPASAAHTSSEVLRRARSDPAYAAFLLLRIGFTVLPIVFGLDKFTNVLTKWEVYLAPWIVDMSPISAHQVMLVVGVIEIVAGVAVAIKPRYAAYIVAAWLAGIIVNLLSYPGFYDVALRDVGLLLAALTLGRPGLGVRPGLASAHHTRAPIPLPRSRPHRAPLRSSRATTPATGERRDPLVSRKEPAMHSSAALQLVHPSTRTGSGRRGSGRRGIPSCPGDFTGFGKSCRHTRADGARLRRAVHAADLRSDHLPQRRGLRRTRDCRATCRCDRCASTTCCPLSGSPTSGICPASASSGYPSSPASPSTSPADPNPGTTHKTDRRLARRTAAAPRCRRGHRGRAHLHDPAGRASRRIGDHHLHPAGRAARRPAIAPGVLRTHRRQHLTNNEHQPREMS